MEKIAKFHKVSFRQFYKAMKEEFGNDFEDTDTLFQVVNLQYERLKLPKRATAGSAGYDFFSPTTFRLAPGDSIKIPTGIRAFIDEGWFLMCVPRSGLGFKYRLRLANVAGIIDQDYVFSDNEGQIYAKLVNEGDKALEIKAGDAFMQGIFLPFGLTNDDDVTEARNGGFGSTDRKE